MSSKPKNSIVVQVNLFNSVESNPILLDPLWKATSTSKKATFIEILLETLFTSFDRFGTGKQHNDLFLLLLLF